MVPKKTEDIRSKDDFWAERGRYATALKTLSTCLAKHHNRNVIILLDEYDVPLENAYYRGFYQEMTDFIRSLFESCLKTNDALEFAVITGCLRIGRESIFTGLNHLEISSIYNNGFEESFGFTQKETEKMLIDYGMADRIPEAKEWFDVHVKQSDSRVLYKAVMQGDTNGIEDYVNGLLEKSISTFDSNEAFYHGFYLSLLYGMPNYTVQSNREEGDGRPDIILYPNRPKDPAIIFEIKTRKKFNEMEGGLTEACRQIHDKRYEEGVLDDGYLGVVSYGICFCKKSCIVGECRQKLRETQ